MRNQIGYKDIKLTTHAKERASERLGLTNSEVIRKMAVAAKHKGLNLNLLNNNTYTDLGITKELYNKLKSSFVCKTNTDACYYYKEVVYVFTGFKSRTLRTVVDLRGF